MSPAPTRPALTIRHAVAGLLPLALANVVVTAAALIDFNLFLAVVGVLVVVGLVLLLAYLRRRGRRRTRGARVLAARQA